MKVLIDTNVILDYLLKREPYYKEAAMVSVLLENNVLIGYISASSITDIFYIASKELKNKDDAKELLRKLTDIVNVASVTEDCIKEALELEWNDFEDSVQYVVGKSITVDCIVTRNVNDYIDSDLKVLTPSEFLDSVISGE